MKLNKTAFPSQVEASYRQYTFNQIGKRFDLVIEEGMEAKHVDLITCIDVRTAQIYI